eukprot:snap_masked-scaffold_48-processed-gene-1.80-mRNA-1 protein AED:1.00 eAED:1.00 QI:0/0/0/0/1/1/2/0/77
MRVGDVLGNELKCFELCSCVSEFWMGILGSRFQFERIIVAEIVYSPRVVVVEREDRVHMAPVLLLSVPEPSSGFQPG